MFGLFTKRIDRGCMEKAGQDAHARLARSLDAGCSIYCTEMAIIDEAIRRIPDAQMMVLSIARAVLNFSIQDAYYDAGLANVFEGLPKIKYNADDERQMIRNAIGFLPTSKSNIDMRFRYLLVSELGTPAEMGLWNKLDDVANHVARRSFEAKSDLRSYWVGFVNRLHHGDVPGAVEILESQ